MADIKTTAQSDLNDTSRYLTVEVIAWYERRLAAVNELASLALNTSLQDDALRPQAEFTRRIFPDFRHIRFLDINGQRILDVESSAAWPLDGFDDNTYLEQLKRSHFVRRGFTRQHSTSTGQSLGGAEPTQRRFLKHRLS